MVGLVHQHRANWGESLPTARMGKSCFVDGPVGQCLGGPKRCITASLGTTDPTCVPIPSHLLPGGAGAALWATHEQDESWEAVLGCPQRPGPWPCFETCFWPLTKARQGSLSSESGERPELGLSTAFSQSGSVMTVTKEVASGRTESINNLSFIKENPKLHHFLCYLNFALLFFFFF